jgi:hypothetical protein
MTSSKIVRMKIISPFAETVEKRLGLETVNMIEQLLNADMRQHAELFLARCKEKFKLIRPKRPRTVWVWSEDEERWQERSVAALHVSISQFMGDFIDGYQKQLERTIRGASNAVEWKQRLHTLTEIRYRTGMLRYARAVARHAQPVLYDSSFVPPKQ